MWCPKCRTEYNEGITVCSDCGTKLIEKPETADYINVCEISDESTADELLEFLSYSKVEDAVKERTEDSSGFRILVPEKSLKKAEKMVHGYLIGKADEKQKKEDSAEDSPEENLEDLKDNPLLVEEIDEDSSDLLYTTEGKEYVKKADKYSDLKFSGITFIIFGILGGVYLLLTKLKVIPVSYNIYVFCVISALFAGFIISGIISFIKAGKIKELIPLEEEKMGEIREWLTTNVTKECLEEWTDSAVSPSENDLLLIARIQVLLRKQFPEEEKAFLEMLADEYYEETALEE